MHLMRNRWARGALLATFLFSGVAYAGEEERPADASGAASEPATRDGQVQHRFSSKKKGPAEDAEKDTSGRRIVGPHGPAMDGVRGSGIAPAPGAFGTDAGSPSDLHR